MQNLMELALFDDLFVRGNAEENSLSLTDVMNIGNSIRERKGLPIRDLYEFYLLNDTKEYIIALYKSDSKEGLISNTGYNKTLKNNEIFAIAKKHYIKTKRGNNGGTNSNFFIGLKLSEWLGFSIKEESIKDKSLFLKHRKIKSSISKATTKSKGLYCIRCKDCLKIGIASNPLDRMASLQVGNPYELFLEWFVECEEAYATEKFLHQKYKNNLIRGEWFHGLNSNKILNVIKNY